MNNKVLTYGINTTIAEIMDDVIDMQNKNYKLESFEAIGNNEGFKVKLIKEHDDILYCIGEEDVDLVVDTMTEFYEEEKEFDKDRATKRYKILKKLKKADKENLYDLVKYKMELPWFEYVESIIECKLFK